MADPESRGGPKYRPTFKMIKPGEEKVMPAPKPKPMIKGGGVAKFVKPGDADTTGANKAYPYETMAAQAKRERREFEALAEVQRKIQMRDSVIDNAERYKMRDTKKHLKKIGIMI